MPHQSKKLTKWESGQELVKINDELLKTIEELKNSDYVDLQIACEKARELIVESFNDHNLIQEMGFGI